MTLRGALGLGGEDGWDVGEEARGRVMATEGAAEGADEVEVALGAGHADVAEAALFFDLLRTAALKRAEVRQQAFLHAGGELEAFGRVERDERDGIRLLVVLVDIRDECYVLQEGGEGMLRFQFVVLCGDDSELLNVLPALLAVRVRHDVWFVVGAVDDGVQ